MDVNQNPRETPALFPLLRVAGKTYREIGGKIGASFSDRIRGGIEARRAWVEKIETFVAADRPARYACFLAAVRDEFPHLITSSTNR